MIIYFKMPNKQNNIKRPWVAERVDYSRRTTTNTSFYNSWPWRKLRKRFIETNPNCKKCEDEGVVNEGKYIDHIQRIEDGGDKTDENNLQTLCKYHHDSKSGKEAHGYREIKGHRGQNTKT
jgi:5-methylcytosine-specific restriction endonuclease McrA